MCHPLQTQLNTALTEVKNLSREGFISKISAIRMVRAITGFDLLRSKEEVQSWEP